ncbi:MAG TPA: hypothetical protein PLJ21_10910, partial [Pseudobdellovibrionaceae bacterium]|nr:hypothetical protein [Pseudobdellovibrionaceae bacterium]
IDGADSDQVAIFDEVTRKVHLFQLSDMKYISSLVVRDSTKKHSVVAPESGNYIIDLYEKHISIYKKNGEAIHDPVSFAGNPLSVAYRSDLNLFVLYDSLNSVVIMQLDASGNLIQSWTGGSLLSTWSILTSGVDKGSVKSNDSARAKEAELQEGSIISGELLSSGTLVLALKKDFSSSTTLALVNVAETLKEKKWIYTSFVVEVGNISWIAGVRAQPDQIFVKAENTLVLIDLNTQTQVASQSLDGFSLEKLSKNFDPHVVARLHNSSKEIVFIYPQNGVLKTRSLQKQEYVIVGSMLNLDKDIWGYLESTSAYTYNVFNNSIDQIKTNRVLKTIRPSDMLPLRSLKVADKSQGYLNSTSILELYPSDLGYASRTDLLTESKKEAKYFNLGHH